MATHPSRALCALARTTIVHRPPRGRGAPRLTSSSGKAVVFPPPPLPSPLCLSFSCLLSERGWPETGHPRRSAENSGDFRATGTMSPLIKISFRESLPPFCPSLSWLVNSELRLSLSLSLPEKILSARQYDTVPRTAARSSCAPPFVSRGIRCCYRLKGRVKGDGRHCRLDSCVNRNDNRSCLPFESSDGRRQSENLSHFVPRRTHKLYAHSCTKAWKTRSEQEF